MQFDQILELIRLDRIALFLFCFALLMILVKTIAKLSKGVEETFPSRRILIMQVASIISFSLYVFGSLSLIYVIIQPPKEILFGLGGSAAVALGFSLKDLVASMVAGFILLFDKPFNVGDRVSFDGTYGEITGIGLRTVRLQTLDDNSVTIPNSRFLSEIASSGNAGALSMMITTSFHLAIQADLATALRLIHEVVITSKYVYIEKPVEIVSEEVILVGQPAIKLLVKAYVFDIKYEKKFQSDIVNRTIKALNGQKIERPRIHLAPAEIIYAAPPAS